MGENDFELPDCECNACSPDPDAITVPVGLYMIKNRNGAEERYHIGEYGSVTEVLGDQFQLVTVELDRELILLRIATALGRA
jgi:hypothetical protein